MTINYSKARQLAIACQESYEAFSDQRFKLEHDSLIPLENPQTDTQGLLLVKDRAMTIIFQGTNSPEDWRGNLRTRQTQIDFAKRVIQRNITNRTSRTPIYPYAAPSKSGVQLHRGFSTAYLSLREEIHNHFKRLNISQVTVTGHSLGGAIALICAVDLQYNFSEQLQHLETYTFGAPKAGNPAFKLSYERRVPKSYRFVNGMDIVVELPRWWQGYPRHVKQQVRLGERLKWNLFTAPIKDHAIASYILELNRKASYIEP